MTMNGWPTGCSTPSTVTCPSSITSRRADWVFGDARLISSASTIEWKIGPGMNSKRRVLWSYTCTPVTSDGSRSGVNCMRAWDPLMVLASALASEVFPVPGKSSSNRCPSDSRQVNASRTTKSLPRIAPLTLATIRSNVSLNRAACSVVTVMPYPLLVLVPRHRSGDSTAGDRDPLARIAVPVTGVLALVRAPGPVEEPARTMLAVEGAGDVAAEVLRLHMDIGAGRGEARSAADTGRAAAAAAGAALRHRDGRRRRGGGLGLLLVE